ncbi:MAG TPA: CAP domain-containing protein [Mycobacteriales bacterium]|nr:CAP domain-containing protein [Mycobacteriales bacterium]
MTMTRTASRFARITAAGVGALLVGTLTVAPAVATTSGTATSNTGVHQVTKKKATKKVAAKPAKAVLTPYEARLLVLTNQARVANGLRPLVAEPGPTDVARRWSVVLAKQDGLSHNPAIESNLEHAGSPNWTALAENVGMGPAGDADTIFTAYMNSPHHRANILDPAMRYIGIGAVSVNTPDYGPMTFNTMDFTNSYNPKYGADKTHPLAMVVDDVDQLTSLLRFGR